MPIVDQRTTDRFILRYDDTMPSAQTLAQSLGDFIETDFFRLRQYLPFDNAVTPDYFQRHKTFVVFMGASSATTLGVAANQLPGPGGAKNFNGRSNFTQGVIWINATGATGVPITLSMARFLFIAEMSEQLMDAYGWIPNSSRGEALSRVLAEELFPDPGYEPQCISVAPWVNGWLNSSPRPDYIKTNPVPTPTNQTRGGDIDQIGYGCGILFINYLRHQLGYALHDICRAGGTTLADSYHNLTSRSDDPYTAMDGLLTKHFGSSYFINLRNNNPFPLLDSDQRKVSLGFDRKVTDVPPPSGVPVDVRQHRAAHLSPFVGCPEKDYGYGEIAEAVTWTVTAFATGFALPQFAWKINATPLFSQYGAMPFAVTLDVPLPNDPRNPKHGTASARFGWSYATSFTRDATMSVAHFTNLEYAGRYHLDVSVEVTETLAAGPPTSAQATIDFNGLVVRYEDAYYADGRACEKRFRDAVPVLEQMVDLVLNAPDPMKEDGLARVISRVDAVRGEIQRLHQADPALAGRAAEFAAVKLGIPAALLRGPARPMLE